MRKFFIQFEQEDDCVDDMLKWLKSNGETHEILGTLYCFVSKTNHSSLTLRDSLLECSENSRVIIMEIPEGLNAAWHLTVENSNWLKSIL